MDLDRRRGKNGQVGWIWKNIGVSHDADAWVGDVEPVGHLPVGDEVNSAKPRSVFLKRAKVVSQLVVITVAISAVAGRAIILQGQKARRSMCRGATQESVPLTQPVDALFVNSGSHKGRPVESRFVRVLSCSHTGSLPFTHVITASIGLPPTMSA